MPFQPGQSGNPRGRPRGSRNKNSLAVREWATRIVEDPKVQARLPMREQGNSIHGILGVVFGLALIYVEVYVV